MKNGAPAFLFVTFFLFLSAYGCKRMENNDTSTTTSSEDSSIISDKDSLTVKVLDKDLFKAIYLPTDTYEPYGGKGDNTIDKIWDSVYNVEVPSFLTAPGSGLPQWITFYLGVKAKLVKMRYYQRGNSNGGRLYHGGNLKKFEVWGSNDPNPDGSWESWTLLMTCESKKPSASPPGQTTQEDINYALAGENFIFSDSIPAVQFIRIKTIENWDTQNRAYANIGELTFWGTKIEKATGNNDILNNPQDDGYRGIWYFIGHIGGLYQYKYAGGLGTYPVNIYPFSVYVPEVNKTYFCYGGSDKNTGSLLHEVGYYNHLTGKVSRPTIVIDKHTKDGHDNPCIQVDKDGYIWLFSNAHGTSRPSFIHKSVSPYNIKQFDNVHPVKMEDGNEVPMTNFSYLQVYYNEDKGFLGLFTHYQTQKLKYGNRACRIASYMTSSDGIHWSAWRDLANIEEGSYQNSAQEGEKVGTVFNYHPTQKSGSGLDFRTNLYYLETNDFGKTWETVNGVSVNLPLRRVDNSALIHDYASEGLKVYINDVNFDNSGNPVILYETTLGWEPGPQNGQKQWYTAHWTGSTWNILPFTTSDNNYDMGSLYIESDGTWRVIAPTASGPQPYNTGGEVEMWTSHDNGHSWQKAKVLTPGSENNMQYPRRPVNANPDFYAFWADGNGRKPSESNLYFSTKDGDVFKLPREMKKEEEKPIPVFR